MKKRTVMVALLLVCMVVLSSCGCKHEWTEADCLTAKTCSLCQETEGEPLGHDWQEADCENPRLCTRCGLTQGEALGHSFGSWVMGETEMTRTCETCGSGESVEPDYDVYLQQEMQGHWGMHFIYLDGKTYTGYSMKQDVLLFNADVVGNQFRYFDMQEMHECTLAYESHKAIENGVQYWLLASKDGEPFTSVSFLTAEGGDTSMVIPLDDESYVWLKRFEEATEVLEGTWVAANKGVGYQMTFCKDGTFTGTLPDGEASGTWHLRTVADIYGSGSISALLNLSYERDGEQKVDAGSIYFGSTDAGWDTYQESASISLNNTGLSFSWIAEDQLAVWETALEEGPKKLVGEWTGMEERNYDYDSRESTTTVPVGYTITFLEDGTFTAVLGDEEMTGVWYFGDVFVNSGNISYTYKWKQKETDKEEYHISLYDRGKLNLGLPSGKNSSRSVEFMQLTEENLAAMAEAEEKPLGLWTSTSLHIWNYETETDSGRATTEYSVEFLEDGTFTAKLDREVSGNWRFSEINDYGNGISFHYRCGVELENAGDMYFYVQEDGSLYLHYQTEEDSYSFQFARMDAAEKAALEAEMEEAKLLPVGTWVSEIYYTWNNNTQEQTEEPHSGYSLTVNADGTVTGQLDTAVDGTWQLREIYHGDGYTSYSYTLAYEGKVRDWNMSVSQDGGLSVNYYADGISHSYGFEKQ